MICVGLIYAAFCIWYAKVPSDMIITNSNDMIKMSILTGALTAKSDIYRRAIRRDIMF